MAISATGLGSGLDISGLVKQLVDAERAGPDLQISRETSKINTKLSAMGSIKGAIAGFQTALAGLNVNDSYGKRSATSSNTNAVSATAANSAVPNSYSMEVTSLPKRMPWPDRHSPTATPRTSAPVRSHFAGAPPTTTRIPTPTTALL